MPVRSLSRQAAGPACDHPHPHPVCSERPPRASGPALRLGTGSGAALTGGFPPAGCRTAQQRALQQGPRSWQEALSARYPDGERALRASHAAGEERTAEPPFARSRRPESAEEPREVNARQRAGCER